MSPEELQELLYRENIKLASVSKRAIAFMIDELLLSLVFVIALFDSISSVKDSLEMIEAIESSTFYFAIAKIAYQTFFTYKYGGSLGKIYMKIKVVDINSLEYLDFFSSLNRAVVRIISEMFFYLGFLWGVLNPTRQTWHDLIAKSIVIEN